MKCTLAALAVFALAASSARAAVLYDASLDVPSKTPAQAPWSWTSLGVPDGSTVETGSVSGQVGYTTLTTTQGSGGTGATDGFFASKGSPFTDASFGSQALNRIAGYTVNFNVAITAEAHAADNQRSGFDIIVESSDHLGVEIGFWTNTVFAYNSDATFTPGESVAWNSTGMNAYALSVLGNNYVLSSGNTVLLQGALRSYSKPGSLPVSPFDIYQVPDFIFLGDDTTRASATANIAKVEVVALPEPATLGFAAIGAAGLLLRRRRAPGA